MSFLSKTLVSELTLCQRSSYLEKHALFKMIKEGFRDIYLNLCSSFRTNLYADNDIIFGAGRVRLGACVGLAVLVGYRLRPIAGVSWEPPGSLSDWSDPGCRISASAPSTSAWLSRLDQVPCPLAMGKASKVHPTHRFRLESSR